MEYKIGQRVRALNYGNNDSFVADITGMRKGEEGVIVDFKKSDGGIAILIRLDNGKTVCRWELDKGENLEFLPDKKFLLPKKWCVKNTNKCLMPYVELIANNSLRCNAESYYYYYNHNNKFFCNMDCPTDYTEITFEQFLKYVLNINNGKMEELKITKEKVLEAASKYSTAEEILKILFPEVFIEKGFFNNKGLLKLEKLVNDVSLKDDPTFWNKIPGTYNQDKTKNINKLIYETWLKKT